MLIAVGICLGLALAASLHAQDSYPPPLPTPTIAASAFGQPGYIEPTPDPFLEGIDAVGASPAVIVSEQQASAPPDTSDGLLFLWTGFVAAGLVFATSIVGSLLLFTRRNE
jgi:hypothetical protein